MSVLQDYQFVGTLLMQLLRAEGDAAYQQTPKIEAYGRAGRLVEITIAIVLRSSGRGAAGELLLRYCNGQRVSAIAATLCTSRP
jgi:hypothetical protein